MSIIDDILLRNKSAEPKLENLLGYSVYSPPSDQGVYFITDPGTIYYVSPTPRAHTNPIDQDYRFDVTRVNRHKGTHILFATQVTLVEVPHSVAGHPHMTPDNFMTYAREALESHLVKEGVVPSRKHLVYTPRLV